MDSKEKLLSVVNALINDNAAQAATDFHEVMAAKMRSIVNEKEDENAEKMEDEAIAKLQKAQAIEKQGEKHVKK